MSWRTKGHWFAVAYRGLDPVTGRDRRRWIAASDREDAEQIAADLPPVQRPATSGGITVGRYLRRRWLPAKKPALRPTTWFRYHKMTELYICPKLESVPLTSLATRHLEGLYTHLLHHGRLDCTGGLAPKTVLNVHQVLRKALGDAVRMQLVTRNVALAVDRPARDICPEQRCWTAAELQRFPATAASHRLHPAMWLAATTGMRRGELLGLLA
jgi:integrase